jgi:hypothetical protein
MGVEGITRIIVATCARARLCHRHVERYPIAGKILKQSPGEWL